MYTAIGATSGLDKYGACVESQTLIVDRALSLLVEQFNQSPTWCASREYGC